MERLTKREKDNVVLVDYDYTEMKEKFLDYVNDVSDCINLETALDKLADYEDKEEQEVVSDSLYAVNKDNKGLWAINRYGGIIGLFGHSVFATEAEAEEALAKMNKED